MTIKTKFNVGDFVYYIKSNGTVRKGKVFNILVNLQSDGEDIIQYKLWVDSECVYITEYEKYLFTSEEVSTIIKEKESLNAQLINSIKTFKKEYEEKFNIKINNLKFEDNEIIFDEVMSD